VAKGRNYKSTLLKRLEKNGIATFMTVHGTQAFEQIQGVWIMEMAELIGLRKNRR
jgi:hypothetical protein